jgi:hypothetical protein
LIKLRTLTESDGSSQRHNYRLTPITANSRVGVRHLVSTLADRLPEPRKQDYIDSYFRYEYNNRYTLPQYGSIHPIEAEKLRYPLTINNYESLIPLGIEIVLYTEVSYLGKIYPSHLLVSDGEELLPVILPEARVKKAKYPSTAGPHYIKDTHGRVIRRP